MAVPHDELVATIRIGLARCPRRWYRALSLGLDPDETEMAERILAQTILEELESARYELRRPLASPPVGAHEQPSS
jgi:hypothetical protein